MKTLVLASLLALFPLAALADDAPIFVSYGTSNGSLPPEYAWDNKVTIHEDGKLLIKHCKGYETEGSACKTRKGKVTPEAMEAIRAAALASNLAADPADETMYPTVGGGGDWGVVYLEGQEYELLWEAAEEDAERVGAVKSAIRAAIPDKYDRFMHPD